jgi:hypothetical protein
MKVNDTFVLIKNYLNPVIENSNRDRNSKEDRGSNANN